MSSIRSSIGSSIRPMSTMNEERAPATAPALANGLALGITLSTAGVVSYAFNPARAGQGSMLAALGAFYAALSVPALYRLHRRGELRRRFRPAYGDITLGAATAGVLYGSARIVGTLIAAHGSPREAWVAALYHQLGNPDAPGRTLTGAAVFAIAALEEIVWRGLVMGSIQDVAGPWRGAIYTTLLYAAAHLPTLVLLRAPLSGDNPLVIVAALGCGLVWSLMVLRTGRLVPSLVAHALFSWAIIEFPLWQP
jgi:membrane protease YdiL (CAAX protease family)